MREETHGYAIGFALALALTVVTFAVVRWPVAGRTATLALVFSLTMAQVVVQFRYFLHITLSRQSRDDLQLILFTSLIIGLMVAGTLVVLENLRMRMM